MSSNNNDHIVTETESLIFRKSGIHGTGGFAKQGICKDVRIIEYVGEKITKAESLLRCEADNEFIFTVSDEFDIDGSLDWNPARFINHSCAPNCDAEIIDDHVWIVANRDIAAGEEVTFNYAYDLEEYRDYPCICGSPNCVGFIVAEEYFDHVRRNTFTSV